MGGCSASVGHVMVAYVHAYPRPQNLKIINDRLAMVIMRLYMYICTIGLGFMDIKVAVPSFKPEVRLHAK